MEKTRTSQSLFASRLTVIALAAVFTIGLAACGGDDEPEKSPTPVTPEQPSKPEQPSTPEQPQQSDEQLSDATTPITFKFGESPYTTTGFVLFDYTASGQYVGTDTIHSHTAKLDLRQGRHRLLWVKLLGSNDSYNPWWQQNGYPKFLFDTHFDPETKTFTNYDEDGTPLFDIRYSDTQLDVTPYLMPAQEIKMNKQVSASVTVRATDVSQNLMLNVTKEPAYGSFGMAKVGSMTGLPLVRTVGLDDNTCEPRGETIDADAIAYVSGTKGAYVVDSISGSACILCPLNGIDNIQLQVHLKDAGGNPITTTPLPPCSVRRGQRTILSGPLFTGTTADWKITMESY